MPVTPSPAVMAGAVFMCTLLFVLAAGGAVMAANAARFKRRRLARAAGGSAVAAAAGGAERDSRSVRRAVPGRFQALELALHRAIPGSQGIQALLARTGAAVPLSTYLLTCLAVAGLAALLARLSVGLPWGVAVPVGLLAGYALPRAVTGYLGARRINAFIAELPDALDVIVRGLKAGLPISEMIGNVADDFEGPVGTEFRHVADTMRLGNTLEDALWDVASRIEVSEFSFLAVSIGLQRETGGNLTETLQNLSDLLRRRQQMRMKIKAMSSEARASAYIIGSLPFVIGAMIYLVNPDYMSTLFTEQAGHYMLAGAALSEATGVAVLIKLMRFEI